MAAFEAVERLQKFDWLIQKLHSLRSSLQSEQGLQELQKLHALQLLQRNGVQFNGSSIGESEEEDKMEMCKMDVESALPWRASGVKGDIGNAKNRLIQRRLDTNCD